MRNKLMLRILPVVLLCAVGAGVGGQARRLQAQPAPATTATPTGDIAKALEKFRQGLKELGSQKYAKRRAGSAALREALASLMARMINVIGPERQTRVDHLLEYQGDLTRWARSLMQLPPQRRLKMLQWGLSTQRLPLVAGVFSPQQQRRADIAHPLAKIPGRNAAWLLERLLRDPRRLVYITAMDAAWNRKPTPAMIKTVWRRAVLLGMQPYNPPNNQHMAMFRGQRIILYTNNNYWMQVQDGVYATRLLLHWKPRGLSRLVVASLAQMALIPATQSIFNTPYTPQAKDFAKLLALVKPAAVEPYLLYEINLPMVQNFMFNFNNKPGHFSNRTLPLYLLVQMAHLNPSLYHLYYTPMYNGVWATGTVAQENADIKKITAWYAKKGIKPITTAQLKSPPAGHVPQSIR